MRWTIPGLLQLAPIILSVVSPPPPRPANDAPVPPAVPPTPPPQPFCSGAYADDFGALSATARDFDHHPEATFSYCTRNVAVYECLSYAADGAVRRERKRARMHGTAFAYRRQGEDTLLLTNDHVAAWPNVTDAQHTVDGVPAGCKKVSESLALVDDERDAYARDDIPVSLVVTDPALDAAVLKARAPLQVMRWKVGNSAALRERNVVEVRGFPLGAFRATNVGKVISAHDHDDEGVWNHDDFVTDALLSAGNSGSPVLAISCATGEYELVGLFHAGYTGGSALNVVIGIDQVRDLMTTLKRAAPTADATAPLDRTARDRLTAALADHEQLAFPFGGQIAVAYARTDGTIFYSLYPKDYPFSVDPMLVMEDLTTSDESTFGSPGGIWFGSARGLKGYERATLDSDAQTLLASLLRALRADVVAHVAYRHTAEDASTRQLSDRLRSTMRVLQKTSAGRADLVQAIGEEAERLSPQAPDRGLRLADLLATPSRPTADGSPLATVPLVRSPRLGPKP
jgi:serine protease Do